MLLKLQLLYVAFCKRFGPEGYTYSAYAWKLHLQGRDFWRNRIDGGFLLLFGFDRHCELQYEREQATR